MINILMSTYNGGRFLSQQLDSILQQSVTAWQLFIRDDGSSDDTRRIVSQYSDPRIHLLEADGRNLGAMHSFEYLLTNYGDADYIAFADQDDVWMPDKLELCLDLMTKGEHNHGSSTPVVIHTDLTVVDSELKEIAPSFWRYSNLQPDLIESNIHFLAIANCLTGCTMLISRAAAQAALPFSRAAYMHDAWIALAAMKAGGIICPLNRPTMLYRQHGKNTLGAVEYRFTLTQWKWKYFLAKRSYTAAHPIVFSNPLQFVYWKIRYFLKLHL